MPTPGKLVVLKLDGDLEQQGFRVALEIGLEGDRTSTDWFVRPAIERMASLPPDPSLVLLLDQWQQAYRSLGIPSRIIPQEIIYGGSVNWQESCQQTARALRDRFNRWLDAEEFRWIDRCLRESLNLHEPIRMVVRTQDWNVRRLPWHLWNLLEHYTQIEISLSSLTVQRLSSTRTAIPDGKVRILAILGNCAGINVEADRSRLQQLPNAAVTFLVEPPRQQLNQQLWQQPWDILFFAGHSQTEGEAGRLYINPQESLTLAELKYALHRAIAQGLQLAIFNSCDGLGLAQELEQLHLPQLIVMREPVPDPVAQEYLQYFLTALVQGEPLHLAARQAREQLQGLEDRFPCASWLPMLFQHALDWPLTWQRLLGLEEPYPNQSLLPEPTAIAVLPVKSQDPRPSHYSWGWVGLISLAVTFLAMGLRWLGALQLLELAAYDRMVQWQANTSLDPRLLLVTVTDRDVETYQDPLSDRTVHQLLTKIERFQPRVIGLDIYRDFPQREGWPELVNYLQTSDRTIALCRIGDFSRVLAIPPAPGISPTRLGFSDAFVPDGDGTIRRYALSMDAGDSPCATPYSFSWQIVRRFLAPETLYHYEPGNHIAINRHRFALIQPNTGGYQLSATETLGYQILIPYRSTQVAQQISLTELLTRPEAELQAWIKDRVVLIGYVGENAKADYHPTPLGEMAGVQIHAQVASQLLASVLEQRSLLSAWPPLGDTIWVWIWAVVGGMIGWQVRSPWKQTITTCIAVIGLGASCWLLLRQSVWAPLVPAGIVLLTTVKITANRLTGN